MSDFLGLWRGRTNEAIDDALRETSRAVSPVGSQADELLEPLTAAAAGGKRLRALLTLASYEAHGGDDASWVAHVAAAIELFQTAALLHDDVLDGSDTRRGEPAAHRRIEKLHATAGWTGSSEAYGTAGGILAGDIALMACHRALGRAVAHPASPGSVVADLFASMAELVTAGQYADMRAAVQPLEALGGQRDEILTVMRTKTASYSAQYPLMLGAAAAGAETARLDALARGGLDLGVAFQLRDDILGVTGSPDVTGKPAGDDVREGKRTLLVWHTWTHGSDSDRDLLRATLGDRTASDREVEAVVDAMSATGAIDAAEHEVAELAASAEQLILDASLAPHGAAALRDLASAAVNRTH